MFVCRLQVVATMIAVILSAVLAASGSALAEEEAAGAVAAVEGTAEIGRDGNWEVAVAGAPVYVGDELRTGNPGRLRIAFRDDTALNLAEDTSLVVDQQLFAPEQGLFRSSIDLLRGKVRALVGKYYSQPGAEYEVRTVTAVAGVRGTGFIVSFDPEEELTRVIGIEGRVEVRSTRERIAQSVFITSGELTEVGTGVAPEEPRLLDEPERQHYLDGLDFVSVGTRGLGAADPVVSRQAVPAPDRAPVAQAGGAATVDDSKAHRDVSDLLGQPPGVVEKTSGGARIVS